MAESIHSHSAVKSVLLTRQP